MKRWILFVVSLSLLFCGCASSSYQRSTKKGEIQTISLSVLLDKVQRKQTFAVMLTQSTCGYCQEFEQVLTAYQEHHGVVMYNVVLDQEDATPEENLALIKPIFADFKTTPGIFYVEKGKEKSQLQPKDGEIDTSLLDKWVQTYQLDRKPKSKK